MDVLIIGGGGAIAAPVVAALAEARAAGRSDVSIALLARAGRTLSALRETGLVVRYDAPPAATSRKDPLARHEFHVEPRHYTVSDRLEALGGPKDFIILGLKATEVTPEALEGFETSGLLGPATRLVTLQNGVPYWLPLTEQARDHGLDAVHSVDPGGRMVRRFGPATIGGFTAAAAGQIADGTGNGLPATSLVRGDFPYTFGMPDGSRSPELGRLVETLRLGGLNVKQAGDISKETWIKILGNATFNMISVIFDASLRQIEQQAHLNRIALAMMNEVKNVAKRLDVPGAASFDLERRLKAVGALTHRPSTWGDFQSAPADRKTPELDALIGAVVELGTRFGVPTPLLAETYAGLQDLAEALGIYSRPTPAPGGKPALPPEGLKARLAMRLVAASVA